MKKVVLLGDSIRLIGYGRLVPENPKVYSRKGSLGRRYGITAGQHGTPVAAV